MDQRSPTFEATLLYKTAPVWDRDLLLQEIGILLSKYNESLQDIEKIDDVFLLLTCKRIKLLISLSGEALPLDGFLDADRPGISAVRDMQILDRLSQIGSSSTVLVVHNAPENAPIRRSAKANMRNICWDVVDCIYSLTHAELVFWAETETIYAAEEFERACTYLAHQSFEEYTMDLHSLANSPDEEAENARFRQDPFASDAIRTWIESGQTPDQDASETANHDDKKDSADAAEWQGLLPYTLAPQKLPTAAVETVRTAPSQALNRVSIACTSATISMSSFPKIANFFL